MLLVRTTTQLAAVLPKHYFHRATTLVSIIPMGQVPNPVGDVLCCRAAGDHS
jgi:hypothetical protein